MDWLKSIHPFYVYSGGIWLLLLALRSIWWRYTPIAKCETCGAKGKVHNRLRGTWLREAIWFAVFVPPSFVFIPFMEVYMCYFLVRWFVVRECAQCGSEALIKVNHKAANTAA